jgi:hypothetical protein
MLALNRTNKLGQHYHLVEVYSPTPQTAIRTGDKQIVVNHSIHDISIGWYRWQHGMFVQDAFPFLSPMEREFLMTRITAEEWNKTFGEDDGK